MLRPDRFLLRVGGCRSPVSRVREKKTSVAPSRPLLESLPLVFGKRMLLHLGNVVD